MLFPLLFSALLLQVGTPQVGPGSIAIGTYRQEADLLSLQLDRLILRSLPVWDSSAKDGFRAARHAEVFDNSNTTPVLILHLWATWCGPCREEMPVWRKLWQTLYNQNNGRVRVFHIALQDEADEISKFVNRVGSGKMPYQALYFDRDGRLAKNLTLAFDDKSLPPLPITLFLDPERIVRRAIVGSISGRVPEVLGTSSRMLRLVELQEKSGRRPKPVDEELDVFTPR